MDTLTVSGGAFHRDDTGSVHFVPSLPKLGVGLKEFSAALKNVALAVPKKCTLPVLKNALLRQRSGELTIVGYDADLLIAARIAAQGPDGEWLLPARAALDALKALKGQDSLSISFAEGEVLFGDNARLTPVLSEGGEDKYPALFLDENPVSAPLCVAEFSSMELSGYLDQTAYAMSRNDTRYYLNGMLFDFSQGGLNLVATDGQRLALSPMELPGDFEKVKCIIKSGEIDAVRRILSARPHDNVRLKIVYNESGGAGLSARFEIGNYLVFSNLIDGIFPYYKDVIPARLDYEFFFDRAAMLAALKRIAPAYTGVYGTHRRLEVMWDEERNVIMVSRAEGKSALTERVPIRLHGTPGKFAVNYDLLRDMVVGFPGDMMSIAGANGDSCVLKAVMSSSSYVAILISMRW